jgi:Homing endonuclease associated repeat/HNH endonuclease
MRYELDLLHWNTTDQEFLDDLKRVADELGANTVSMRQYDEHGRFAASSLQRRFGSWVQALQRAGLVSTARSIKYKDAQLFSNLVDVWSHLGRQPRHDDLTSRTSRIAVDSYKRRFGGWRKALEAFVRWANDGELSPPSKASAQASVRRASRTINDRVRFVVMPRDKFKCQYCGRSPATHLDVTLHLDHRKPFSQGGSSDFENLITSCSKCNLGKGEISTM